MPTIIYGLVGERIGEMYRGDGFHAFCSDCKYDQSSTLWYVKWFNKTISYLPWWMCGYSKVRVTSATTCSLYIIPIQYQIYC